MEDPNFPVTITVGGTGQSYKFAAFPKELHANQSFVLAATLIKEDLSAYDLSSATATLYVSGWKNTISPVTLAGGSIVSNTITFTVAKDLIPESLGSLPLRNPGNSVFYFIVEDSDSVLQFFQQVNVLDTNYTLSGDVDSSPNTITPDKNDLGTVIEVNLNTPPVSPSFQDAYIIGTSPTGDWSGQNNDLAVYNGSSWVFYDTEEGNFVFDQNTSQQQIFNGTIWQATANIVYSDGESINDNNSNELLEFGVTASAVNHVKITNNATGADPVIEATGGDTNVNQVIRGKGTGKPAFADGTDNTKRALFDLSGITTATDRIITLPNYDMNLAEVDANVDDLVTLSGVAENSTNLGTFTGTTIADNETIKGALQDLEDAVELRRLEYLGTSGAISSAASVEFTTSGWFDGTYKELIFKFIDVLPATDSTRLDLLASTDGGSTYLGGTSYTFTHNGRSGSSASAASATGAQFRLITGAFQGNGTEETYSGTVILFNASSGKYKDVKVDSTYVADDGSITVTSGGGQISTTSAVDAVKLQYNSGNIASGEIRVYGVK